MTKGRGGSGAEVSVNQLASYTDERQLIMCRFRQASSRIT